MTSYEIIMVILGIIGLLFSFGLLLLALLTYISRNNKQK